MGVWSSGDFALLEDADDRLAKYCANAFRYERIEGPGHWMQWEAPDKVNDAAARLPPALSAAPGTPIATREETP